MENNNQRPKGKKKDRFRRERPISVSLQERDMAIIKDVFDHRFLSSFHIRLLHQIGEPALQKRLNKLWRAGYLDRPKGQRKLFLEAGPRHFIYALGNKGADTLTIHYGIDRQKIDWTTKNLEVKDIYLSHALQISNFRVCLALALRNEPSADLAFWKPTGEIKDAVIFQDERYTQKIPIIPDGFFALKQEIPGEDPDIMYFFLEADRGTMTTKRFFNKMRGYWKYYSQKKHEERLNIGNFRVLTITKTEARKENLRAITKGADDRKAGSLMFWFTSEQRYNLEEPGRILGPIWQTPKDDTWHHLLE